MPQEVVQGNSIILDAFYFDGNGDPNDPPDELVSIIDPEGVTIVNLATPVLVGPGHFQYVYAVPADAQPGAWAARWFGTVDGFALTDEDGFTVLRAGTLAPATTCTPWATSEDAPASLLVYGVDPFDVDDSFQAASDLLYELTGRRFPGTCRDIIRPQAQWRAWDGPARWWPALSRGGWGWCSCHRGRETGCCGIPEIKLPGHPVDPDTIVVTIDGAPFLDFRLDDHRFLVRTDGDGWPCCQDLLLDATEEGTWQIAYDFGRLPPGGGKRAAVLLGTMLFGEDHPDLAVQCALPKRATRITRAGTTVDLTSPSDMVKEGLTGIPSVDLWVAAVFMGEARRRATVLVPGRHRSARRPGV